MHGTIRQSKDISSGADIIKVATAALSRQNFMHKNVIIVTSNLDLIVMDEKLSVNIPKFRRKMLNMISKTSRCYGPRKFQIRQEEQNISMDTKLI